MRLFNPRIFYFRPIMFFTKTHYGKLHFFTTHQTFFVPDFIRRWLCPNKTNRSPSFVMVIAITLPHLSILSAHFTMGYPSVKSPVLRGGSTKHQILWAVIMFYSVNVMNDFRRPKIAANYLFHYKPMFSDSIHGISERMYFVQNHHIPMPFSDKLSTGIKWVRLWVVKHKFCPATPTPSIWLPFWIRNFLVAINTLKLQAFTVHPQNIAT